MQSMLFVFLALCCRAFVAKSVALGASNEEKTREAIRLWIFRKPMQYMLTEPMISEAQLQIGKILLDRVRISEPEFETGLIYNSTVVKVQKMLDQFRTQQLIDDDFIAVLRFEFEQSLISMKSTASLRGQYIITGHIIVVDTTVAMHDPKSLSWYYAFCKVAVNLVTFKKLTQSEKNDLAHYMTYLQQEQWLESSGPYCRLLLEKCQAYEKYLPFQQGNEW